MPAILLADDHSVVRDGLKAILEQEFEGVVVGEASQAEEVARAISERRWDVVVLDLAMPGKSGLEIQTEIKAAQPALRVLFLSMHGEAHFALRALRAGAAGYISKDSGRDEFVRAVRAVLAGKKYLSPNLAEAVASGVVRDSSRPPHELLTNREYEVMRAIAVGRAAKEIGAELAISAKTVSAHRRRILDKMGLSSNADLTRYLIENRLL